MKLFMYEAVLVLQYISILVVLAGILDMLPRQCTKQKDMLIIVLSGIFINQVGYTLELQTTTLEAALVAIKVAYIGKMIAELGVFFFICMFCGYKVPTLLKVVLIGIHTAIVGLVWFCESTPLYYSSLDYTEDGLFPHVVLGHGIFYTLFTILTLVYMVIMFIMCVIKLVKAKTASEKGRTVCMAIAPISFMVGLLVYRSGITNGYDTTSLSYMISSVVFIIAMSKFDLVDREEIAKSLILDEIADPVFALDSNQKVFYVNTKFLDVFPNYLGNETEKQSVLQAWKSNEDFYKDGHYYHISAKNIEYQKVTLGEIFVMHDVTESHNYNDMLQTEVSEKTAHIREIQEKMIIGMASMVENRDANTGGHIKRTSEVVRILMEEMSGDQAIEIDEKFKESIIKAAPMHDLGKIAVDDNILRKPGRYTEAEFEQMKEHAAKGAIIVRQLLEGVEDEHFAQIAENVAHYHHERFDGSGYPNHLLGQDIPLEARIMAVADVYDALVSKRCYKEAMGYEEAFQIIESGMGTQFDPLLEKHFVACREKLERYYDSCR